MGDETTDLLEKEADHWRSSRSSLLLETTTADNSSVSSIGGKKHLTPGDRGNYKQLSLKRRPSDQFADLSSYASLSNKDTTFSSDIGERSAVHAPRVDGDISDSSYASRTQAKRRRSHTGPGGSEHANGVSTSLSRLVGETLPALKFDSDLEAALEPGSENNENDVRITSKSREHNNTSIGTPGSGLKTRNTSRPQQESPLQTVPQQPQYSANLSDEALDIVRELSAALDAKTREVRRLKVQLAESRVEHKEELRELVKEVHSEYSRQASKKLRILYQRAEFKAQQKVEDAWKNRLEDLNKAVQKERLEKAELVKACDDYLKLNGF